MLSRLRHHVEALASAPRPPQSAALERARVYVEGHLTEASWQVSREPFDARGLSGVNLIAETGARPADLPLFVVAAHLDSRPETPGADDNASAVAALIELARAVRSTAEASALRLQLVVTDLEECGMLGAAHRADRLIAEGADLRGMVSLEMLGCCDPTPGSQGMPDELRGLYPDTGDFIGVVGNARSQDLVTGIAGAMAEEPGLKVESLAVPGNGETFPPTRLSDHSPFWDRGLPAVMITDTSFFRNPHYHEPTDTPETLDYEFLKRVTGGVIRAVRAIVGKAT